MQPGYFATPQRPCSAGYSHAALPLTADLARLLSFEPGLSALLSKCSRGAEPGAAACQGSPGLGCCAGCPRRRRPPRRQASPPRLILCSSRPHRAGRGRHGGVRGQQRRRGGGGGGRGRQLGGTPWRHAAGSGSKRQPDSGGPRAAQSGEGRVHQGEPQNERVLLGHPAAHPLPTAGVGPRGGRRRRSLLLPGCLLLPQWGAVVCTRSAA
jgi:hypothetical protein